MMVFLSACLIMLSAGTGVEFHTGHSAPVTRLLLERRCPASRAAGERNGRTKILVFGF